MSVSDPKVSVVMSTHNGRREMCRKAIQSVIDQTYEEWELIVVDDASSDGTDEMVKSFSDSRIKYIHRETNWGNDTRPKNDGLYASKGKYICLLDSDNTYRPEHIQMLVQEIEATNVDLVYGDRWIIDDSTGKGKGIGNTANYSYALLMEKNFIDTSDVIVRRDLMVKLGGFDERYRKYVDWNMWVRLAKYGAKFAHLPFVLTNYHEHEGMKSKTVPDKSPTGETSMPMGNNPVHIREWDPIDVEVMWKGAQPKVAIFSLTYDRLDYSKACFASLFDKAGYPFDLYITDNGSQDGTVEYLKDLEAKYPDRVHVIYNPKNVGISKASNQALDAIFEREYDIVGKYDNDALSLTTGWLEKVVDIWNRNNRMVLSCYIEGLRDNPGGAQRIAHGQIAGELVGITKHMGGICCFADARAYESYRWEEQSFLHGVQDWEFSQHLLRNGYQLGYLENWYIAHIDSTQGQHERYPQYFQRRTLEKTTKYAEDRQ